MGIDPDMTPVLDELRADYEREDASLAKTDQELAARIEALEVGSVTIDGGTLRADTLDTLVARLATVERWQAVMDATIVAAVAKLRAWIDASPPAPPSDPD